ncbi:hypothetical protein NDU88_010312 [Pleurodeles waltl]|uniref:Uncharacterized protein n=1 Tax=Pleurodeles waltl TaxID=8319 RepID=A0AAV7PUI3_PLEWA|nr:hypothetical protein NDU88_010312 [Pleurodeles waltl]
MCKGADQCVPVLPSHRTAGARSPDPGNSVSVQLWAQAASAASNLGISAPARIWLAPHSCLRRAVVAGPVATAYVPPQAGAISGDPGAIKGSPPPVLTPGAAPLFQGTPIGHSPHPRQALLTSPEEGHAEHAPFGPRGSASSTLHRLWRSPHRSGQPYGLKTVAGTLPRDPLLHAPF